MAITVEFGLAAVGFAAREGGASNDPSMADGGVGADSAEGYAPRSVPGEAPPAPGQAACAAPGDPPPRPNSSNGEERSSAKSSKNGLSLCGAVVGPPSGFCCEIEFA